MVGGKQKMEAWSPEIKPGTWGRLTCDMEALQISGKKVDYSIKGVGPIGQSSAENKARYLSHCLHLDTFDQRSNISV